MRRQLYIYSYSFSMLGASYSCSSVLIEPLEALQNGKLQNMVNPETLIRAAAGADEVGGARHQPGRNPGSDDGSDDLQSNVDDLSLTNPKF